MLAKSEIPACAGMTERGPGDGELPGVTLYLVIPAFSLSFPRFLCHSRVFFVIPAFSLSFPRKRESRNLIRGDREVPVEMENCPG
jgi:hypothetical protein